MDKLEGKRLTKEELRRVKETLTLHRSCGLKDYSTDNQLFLRYIEELDKDRHDWCKLAGELESTAKQHAGNTEFYRGIVEKIGKLFGDKAKVADDGSIMEDVLCLRVYPLVDALKQKVEELDTAYEQLAGKKFSDRSYHAIKSRAERAEATIENIREAAKLVTDRIEESEKKAIAYGYAAGDIARGLVIDTDDLRILKQACTGGSWKDDAFDTLEGFDEVNKWKKPCPDCGGMGWEKDVTKYCSRCNGSGEVEV